MNVAVAQLGARMHYAVPRILHGAGMLERLYTDICSVKGLPRLLRVVPPPLRTVGIKSLLARVPQGIPPSRIAAFNGFGQEYFFRRRKARTPQETISVHLWAGERFNELILYAGLENAQGVYGFNSASRTLFKFARKHGLAAIYEQTIAPRLIEKQLLEDERARFPEWAPRLSNDCLEAFSCREKDEWALADIILCGSEFVKKGIGEEGGPANKCVVVPYGVETLDVGFHPRPLYDSKGTLMVLFVGSVGLRKGVPYLLEAMRLLAGCSISCRVVGNLEVPIEIMNSCSPPNVDFVGPVPRSDVFREFANADVFCLPSLCEGSATVVYEALSAGLPVITTPNTGSIVRNGVEGYIVPIRDAAAIAERLMILANDRDTLNKMSKNAKKRSNFGSLENYGKRLLKAINCL